MFFFTQNIPEVAIEKLKSILDQDDAFHLIDVRTPAEYEQGHIDSSINIPLDTLEHSVTNRLEEKNATIYLICRSGGRSSRATKLLQSLGYSHVFNVKGGMLDWLANDYPTSP